MTTPPKVAVFHTDQGEELRPVIGYDDAGRALVFALHDDLVVAKDTPGFVEIRVVNTLPHYYVAAIDVPGATVEAAVVGFDINGHAQIRSHGRDITARDIAGFQRIYTTDIPELLPTSRQILQAIADGGCESFTGNSTCLSANRTPLAQYGADACCPPCLIRYALEQGQADQSETKEP